MKNKNAFTLIELLAVIIILSMLAIIGSAAVTKIVKDSKEELSSSSISTQIEQILSKIEGVGECNVLITYANTYETSETSSTKEVQGVIVVCDGGDNLKVVEKITSAIKTLLNINSLNIKVFKSL